MGIDPAFVSAISALVGALIGGSASLAAAIYTQRYQNRLQRIARETAKREQVYAEFIMDASKLLLNAYVHDGIILGGDEQHLVGLANRMRLFAPSSIINEAEAVIRGGSGKSLSSQAWTCANSPRQKWPRTAIPISFSHSARLAGRTWITCIGYSIDFDAPDVLASSTSAERDSEIDAPHNGSENPRNGHSRQANRAAVVVAEPFCRTTDWVHSPKMPRPHHCRWRGTSAARTARLCKPLQRNAKTHRLLDKDASVHRPTQRIGILR